MSDFSFKRGERLKSRKVIEGLFSQGQSFGQYPIRIVWTIIKPRLSTYPVQCAFTVPKRKFPKAVQRNRIKRQMREAFRQKKHILYEALEQEENQLAFMLIYTGKEATSSKEINQAIDKMIHRFLKKWKESKSKTNPK